MPAGFHVATAWVDVQVEADGLRGRIKAAVEGAVAGEDGKLKLDVDAAGLRAKVESAIKSAAAGAKGEVKLDVDAGALRSKVAGAVASAGAGQRVKVGVDFDAGSLRAQVSAAVAAAGAGQRVRIGVDIDRSALGTAQNAVRNIARDTDRAFGSGSFLSRRSGLGSLSVGSVLGLLTMLEPAMGALIAPVKTLGIASAALVPTFLGLATSAAAVIIGSQGVGKAMSASKDDAVAYGQAIGNLSPTAQDFVRSASGMSGVFSQMRLPVQQALFAGLGNELQKMSSSAIPAMTAGLTGMANIMNTAFKSVTSTLTQLGDSGVLGAMFGGLQTAFKPLGEIPGQLVNMLSKVSVAASPLLTRITQSIGGAMTSLSDRVDRAFADGRLQAGIDRAGESIKRFFNNFKSNDAVQGFMDNMKTMGPQVADSLQKIGESGLRLLNASSGIGTALLKIGGGFASIVNAIPTGALTTIMGTVAALSAISKISGGLTRAGTALRGFSLSSALLGAGAAGTSRQATAVRALATAGGSANAAFVSGALSASAIRARTAAMAGESIAVRNMSTRLATAGSSIVQFGSGALAGATAGAKLGAAAKVVGLTLGTVFIAAKGVDGVMDKVFGKPANIQQMAKGFTEFAATGKLSGITAKTLGDNFGKFGEALQKVAHNDVLGKVRNALGRSLAWTGLDAFKDKNKDLVNSVDDTLASLVRAGRSDVAAKVFDSLGKAAEKNGTSVEKLKSTMGDYKKSLAEQAQIEKIAAMSMGTFGTEAVKTQKLLQKNAGEVQGLQQSYNALGRFNATATGAQLAYNQSVSQAQGLLKKHSNALSMQGGLLNTTTPKAQEAAGAMLTMAENAKKAGEAFIAKGDFAAAAKQYDAARNSIMALGRAQGLTAGQAREFANQILPIDRAKLYSSAITQTAKEMKTLTTAMAKAPSAQKMFEFKPNTFTSQARTALESLKGVATKTLDNGKIQIKVETAQAKSQVQSLGKVFDGLSKGVKSIKIPAADLGAVSKALKTAGMDVQKISDTKIKITAEDGTSTIIEGIKGKLEALKGISIDVGGALEAGLKPKASKPTKELVDMYNDLGRQRLDIPNTGVKNLGKNAETAAGKQKKYNKTLDDTNLAAGGLKDNADKYQKTIDKIMNDPKLQAHGRSMSGLGTSLGNAATEANKVGSALDKVKGAKNIQVAVQISGTEDIGKLEALNKVNNKNIQVLVNISGTEDIEKLQALNQVNNKAIMVQVNISGTEDIEKLKALNEVADTSIIVQVSISGTEDIEKLKALNEVNNKSISVNVNISGTEQIEKLKALNEVNNKSVQVSVSISGTEQIEKLKTLNQVNNKSIQVSVSVSGADQIEKLKTLNQVNNKNIVVSVSITGQIDKIEQLKQLNSISNKSISVSVNLTGIEKLSQIKDIPSSKTVTITVRESGLSGIKSKIDSIAGKTVTITVRESGLSGIKSKISGISGKTVTITVRESGAASVKSKISGISGKTVTINVKESGVAAVQAAINSIQGKTVTVTVVTKKVGSAASGGYMHEKTLPGFSSGGRSVKSGGSVYGLGSATSDSILARLSNGEFVIRASMVRKYGTDLLSAINHGALDSFMGVQNWRKALPGFHSGGSVGSAAGMVSLYDVQPGDRNSQVLAIQKALKEIFPEFDYSSGPGIFGPRTREFYSKFQRSMGWSGSDANGSPGMLSLIALMNRTGEFQLKTSQATMKYNILHGDTMQSVAAKFGIAVEDLIVANKDLVASSNLVRGMSINIPTGFKGVPPPPPPGVVPGTKPGDWNFLDLPNFSKISRRTEKDDKGKYKDVSEVNELMGMAGQNMEKQTKMFENFTNTNADDLVRRIVDSNDLAGLAVVLDDMRQTVAGSFKDGTAKTNLQNYLAKGAKIEITYHKMLEDTNKKLEEAQKNLDKVNGEFESLQSSVASTVGQFATLTKTGKAGASVETMIKQLSSDAGLSTQFTSSLAAMRARGLSGTTLAQVAALGPQEGQRTLTNLLRATPEQIAQINALQNQIDEAARVSGDIAANAMYSAGVNAAKGLVDGLTSQKAAITDAMTKIADAMKTAILQALGIKSPSRVMFGYGVNTIQGYVNGMLAQGKSIGEIVRGLISQVTENANGTVKPTIAATGTGGGTATTTAPTGDVRIGNIHVTFQCDGGAPSSPEEAEKYAKMLATYVMEEIRKENKKRK
jgi:hypothetical protein